MAGGHEPRTVNMRDYRQADFDAIAAELNGRPRQTSTPRHHPKH
jgi:IS30 family transposase